MQLNANTRHSYVKCDNLYAIILKDVISVEDKRKKESEHPKSNKNSLKHREGNRCEEQGGIQK